MKPVGTNQGFANYMLHGYWAWQHTPEHYFNTRTITYNIDGLDGDRIPVAERAFRIWDDMTSLTFVRSHGSAKIMVDDQANGAYEHPTIVGGVTTVSTINVTDNWNGGSSQLTDYTLQTFIHEIGHSLGLGHPGGYNGNARWGVDNYFENDSWDMSIMSYFLTSPYDTVYHGYDLTPKSADVLAVEQLYSGPYFKFTVHDRYLSNGFDAKYYLDTNPDVAAAGVDPLQHFNQFGWHEGRNPNAMFDTSWYLAVNPDVAAAGVNPLEHYDHFGWHEGRDPGVHFDTSSYLATNPDVAAAGVNPMTHYYGWGYYEGREAFLV